MINNLDNPTYYLDNFEFVLTWVRSRYEDLLVQSEIAFIERFATLPLASRALLVRMVMRKGNLFRESKLNYAEIGDTKVAASCLIEHGWIEEDPGTSVEQLAALLTKCEFAQALGLSHMKAARKSELLEAALQSGSDRHRFSQWMGASGDDRFVPLFREIIGEPAAGPSEASPLQCPVRIPPLRKIGKLE